LFVIILV